MATKRKLSFRSWATIITVALLAVVVYFAWPEIIEAWKLMGRVNLWVLLLLIPAQIFSYYAIAGIMFSYLRQKGELKNVSHLTMTRMALELNFVNHILPSGGAVGFTYMAWVLKHYGVSVPRATLSQLIRYAMTFLSFAVLLVVSMIALTVNHDINRTVVLIGSIVTVSIIVFISVLIWLLRSRRRLEAFSDWTERVMDGIVRLFTAGKKTKAVRTRTMTAFFDGLYDDFRSLRRERRILIRPFLWALVGNSFDAILLWIAFWSLGYQVDIFVLFISYGLASILSVLSVTPGGAGVYETVTIAFLTTTGISPDVAIAGTLLSRVILVLGTIIFGYAFYQSTILKFGDAPDKITKESSIL